MKHTVFFLICILAVLAVSFPLHSQDVTKGKILLIAREGKPGPDLDLMLNNEVGVMTNLLRQAGFKVSVASPSGQPLIGATKILNSDLKLNEAKLSDYAAVVIPCLARTTELPADFIPVLRAAIAKGEMVAAQAGGVYAMSRAGLLKGKKYAFGQAPTKEQLASIRELSESTYSGTGVVQDGNIITSGVCSMIAKTTGLPDGTSLLTQTVIAAILKK